MSSDPTSRHSIVLIGPGSVGTAVAKLLADAGHSIAGVGPPDRRSARRAVEILRAPLVDLEDLPACDLVLLGTPDGAIKELAARLDGSLKPGAIVCHFSGSWGTEPLAALPEGVGRAALHPVQACPDPYTAIARLPGSAWGVTCSDELRAWATRLVAADLRGRPVTVAEKARPLWHAASVTTANGIAALLATSEAVLAAAGISDPVAVLGPLAAGAVANARQGGGGGATLTGPVVRGESTTVRRHLEALTTHAPDLEASYRAVSLTIIEAARRAGRIDADTAHAMSALLEER